VGINCAPPRFFGQRGLFPLVNPSTGRQLRLHTYSGRPRVFRSARWGPDLGRGFAVWLRGSSNQIGASAPGIRCVRRDYFEQGQWKKYRCFLFLVAPPLFSRYLHACASFPLLGVTFHSRELSQSDPQTRKRGIRSSGAERSFLIITLPYLEECESYVHIYTPLFMFIPRYLHFAFDRLIEGTLL
jgi:hypothetical protein